MVTFWRGFLVVCLVVGATRTSAAQNHVDDRASAKADAPSPQPDNDLWSIARIRDALAREPVLVIHQPTFRIATSERRPTSFDLAADPKPLREPPTWNAGWHNEFLTMVTAPEFRMWQAFTNTDLLQISATSLAAALAAKVIEPVSNWRRNASEAAARDEVDRALADFLATHAGATPEIVPPR